MKKKTKKKDEKEKCKKMSKRKCFFESLRVTKAFETIWDALEEGFL